MEKITLTLHGGAISRALSPIAYTFAFLFIKDTALGVKTPALTAEERERLRDIRATLESFIPELPPIAEPIWPTHYRRADMITVKKGRVHTIAGFSMRIGHEEKPRRGAKPYPYYSDSHASKAATEWRDSLIETLTKKEPSP